MDRVAYINHDIDDAVRAGVISASDLPAEPIAILGDTGQRRIDTLVHDLVEHSEHSPGDIVQGERVGDAMPSCGRSCSSTSTWGRSPRASTRRSTASCRRCSTTTARTRRRSPTSIPDGDLATRVTDYLAGMTDRYCIALRGSSSVPVAFAP